MGLYEENSQVLNLIQALVGAISPNFRLITLELTGPREVCLRFVLERDDRDDREEIDDITFEFEALQDTLVDVRVDVMSDTRSFHEMDIPGRIVYGRKE